MLELGHLSIVISNLYCGKLYSARSAYIRSVACLSEREFKKRLEPMTTNNIWDAVDHGDPNPDNWDWLLFVAIVNRRRRIGLTKKTVGEYLVDTSKVFGAIERCLKK